MFIMVDGIDGSGKSTVIDAWKAHLADTGTTIFDLREYWRAHGRHPEYRELESYDFIVSGEPTYVGIGATIRQELIQNGKKYPPLAIAEAYGLDRLILYTSLLLPALADGKCVIQDRGVSTSLCYQPLMSDTLTTEKVESLPGNDIALKNAPDFLVLVDVNPELALQRLAARTHKQDNVIFEKLDFQKKTAERFASKEFQTLFTKRKTAICHLPGDEEIAILKQRAVAWLDQTLQQS